MDIKDLSFIDDEGRLLLADKAINAVPAIAGEYATLAIQTGGGGLGDVFMAIYAVDPPAAFLFADEVESGLLKAPRPP